MHFRFLLLFLPSDLGALCRVSVCLLPVEEALRNAGSGAGRNLEHLMGVARGSELLLRQTPVVWGLVFGRGWGLGEVGDG